MNHIHVHELMTEEVLCLTPDATLAAVIQCMSEQKRSCIVIVDGRQPVGIITERDVVRVFAESISDDATASMVASDFMTSPPLCLDKNATLYDALVITQARSIRHLPIVGQAEELLGLLSQGDIARAHFRAIEQQREIIEQHIQQRTSHLLEANQKLKALSLQDSLMGIGNRRAMEVDIQYTHTEAQRHQRPYCVALLDVDFFKKYNDHYGHQAGDEVLRQLAKHTQQAIRASDRLYRYGGEELLLLLPETSTEKAVAVVGRVLSSIENADIKHTESPFGHLTISAGVSVAALGGVKSWQDAIKEADERLYVAKSSGRNQVCWQ